MKDGSGSPQLLQTWGPVCAQVPWDQSCPTASVSSDCHTGISWLWEKQPHSQDKDFKAEYLGSWVLPSKLVLGALLALGGGGGRRGGHERGLGEHLFLGFLDTLASLAPWQGGGVGKGGLARAHRLGCLFRLLYRDSQQFHRSPSQDTSFP